VGGRACRWMRGEGTLREWRSTCHRRFAIWLNLKISLKKVKCSTPSCLCWPSTLPFVWALINSVCTKRVLRMTTARTHSSASADSWDETSAADVRSQRLTINLMKCSTSPRTSNNHRNVSRDSIIYSEAKQAMRMGDAVVARELLNKCSDKYKNTSAYCAQIRLYEDLCDTGVICRPELEELRIVLKEMSVSNDAKAAEQLARRGYDVSSLREMKLHTVPRGILDSDVEAAIVRGIRRTSTSWEIALFDFSEAAMKCNIVELCLGILQKSE
jgi:hypothetical protein